jgi:hypothetical protein
MGTRAALPRIRIGIVILRSRASFIGLGLLKNALAQRGFVVAQFAAPGFRFRLSEEYVRPDFTTAARQIQLGMKLSF